MDFELSDEERRSEAVRRFGDGVLRPADAIDQGGQIASGVIRSIAGLGLLAMPVSSEYRGMGASAVLTEIAAEEIGRGDLSMATAVFFLLEAGWGWLLGRHGPDALRRSVLPSVCRGETFLGIATTEPGGGSDLARMRTEARTTPEGFVLKGEKTFVSGTAEAASMGGGHLTLARDSGGQGFHFLYVPTRSPGLSTHRFENMGRMGISTGSLAYDDVRVPAGNLIGEAGRGFELALEGFQVARTFVSAACVGAAERALEIGTAHITRREAFGQPLGKFEGIQFELADLYTQVEAVKWQCRRAAWLLDRYTMRGDDSHRSEVNRAVASVKLTAPPVAFETVKRVMMSFGRPAIRRRSVSRGAFAASCPTWSAPRAASISCGSSSDASSSGRSSCLTRDEDPSQGLCASYPNIPGGCLPRMARARPAARGRGSPSDGRRRGRPQVGRRHRAPDHGCPLGRDALSRSLTAGVGGPGDGGGELQRHRVERRHAGRRADRPPPAPDDAGPMGEIGAGRRGAVRVLPWVPCRRWGYEGLVRAVGRRHGRGNFDHRPIAPSRCGSPRGRSDRDRYRRAGR